MKEKIFEFSAEAMVKRKYLYSNDDIEGIWDIEYITVDEEQIERGYIKDFYVFFREDKKNKIAHVYFEEYQNVEDFKYAEDFLYPTWESWEIIPDWY